MDSEATTSNFEDSEDEYDLKNHCKNNKMVIHLFNVHSGHCRFPTCMYMSGSPNGPAPVVASFPGSLLPPFY